MEHVAELWQNHVQEKIDRLTWLHQEGDLTQEDYRQRKATLQAEMVRIRVPEPVEVVRAVDLLTNIGQVWRAATDDQTQRGLLQAMLEGLRGSESRSCPEKREVPAGAAAVWDLLRKLAGSRGFEPECSNFRRCANR